MKGSREGFFWRVWDTVLSYSYTVSVNVIDLCVSILSAFFKN